MGIPQAIAASYTLVLHVALWLPITLLGAYYYLRQPLRWGADMQHLRKAATPGAGEVRRCLMPVEPGEAERWKSKQHLDENIGKLKQGLVMSKIAIIGRWVGAWRQAHDFIHARAPGGDFRGGDLCRLGFGGRDKEPNWKWSVERYYHHWFQTDKDMLGLIEELGWERSGDLPAPKTLAYHKGKFYPLDFAPGGADLPRLQLFWHGAVLGLVRRCICATWARWKSPGKIYRRDEWMRRWYGGPVYTSMLEPLLVGKFGDHLPEVNMAWMWARLKTRSTRAGNVSGRLPGIL